MIAGYKVDVVLVAKMVVEMAGLGTAVVVLDRPDMVVDQPFSYSHVRVGDVCIEI
jgi:hypothetical protein